MRLLQSLGINKFNTCLLALAVLAILLYGILGESEKLLLSPTVEGLGRLQGKWLSVAVWLLEVDVG